MVTMCKDAARWHRPPQNGRAHCHEGSYSEQQQHRSVPTLGLVLKGWFITDEFYGNCGR
jgi:hypothetical protein